jgi:uncharacterized protein YcnI
MRSLTGLSAWLASVAIGAGAAHAHATIQPKEAAAGSYVQAAVTITHGCDGSPTAVVRVKLPEGIVSAKPQMKPGWNVEIKTRKLDQPQPGLHGKTISEVVDEIVWRGGPLPDNLYDTFGLLLKAPDRPGETLYFPVVQECEKGVHRWIEIPSGGPGKEEPREPAPAIRLKPKSS